MGIGLWGARLFSLAASLFSHAALLRVLFGLATGGRPRAELLVPFVCGLVKAYHWTSAWVNGQAQQLHRSVNAAMGEARLFELKRSAMQDASAALGIDGVVKREGCTVRDGAADLRARTDHRRASGDTRGALTSLAKVPVVTVIARASRPTVLATRTLKNRRVQEGTANHSLVEHELWGFGRPALLQ